MRQVDAAAAVAAKELMHRAVIGLARELDAMSSRGHLGQLGKGRDVIALLNGHAFPLRYPDVVAGLGFEAGEDSFGLGLEVDDGSVLRLRGGRRVPCLWRGPAGLDLRLDCD